MIRHSLALVILAFATTFSHAQPSLPSSFQAKTVHSPEGADIFVRWGGTGAVVVLIHGYAENSDSWAPLVADLMKDHTVVVPDLRGIGKSSKPPEISSQPPTHNPEACGLASRSSRHSQPMRQTTKFSSR